jgi:WD40 repeat protein
MRVKSFRRLLWLLILTNAPLYVRATTLSLCAGLLDSSTEILISTAYQRILEKTSGGLITDQELRGMIDSKDPFTLSELGPSEKEAIRRGLLELKQLAIAEGSASLNDELIERARRILIQRGRAVSNKTLAQTKIIDLRPEYLLEHNSEVQAIAFSSDGRFAASATKSKDILIWDFRTRKRLRQVHRNLRSSAENSFLGFSSDSEWLAIAGVNHPLQIQHVLNEEVKHDLSTEYLYGGMVGGGAPSLQTFGVSADLTAFSYRNRADYFEVLNLATRSRTPLSPRRIAQPWYRRYLPRKANDCPGVVTIALSPDATRAAFTEGAYGVFLWNLKTDSLIKKLTHDPQLATSITFSNHGDFFATAGATLIYLWNSSDGSFRAGGRMDAEVGPIAKVIFSPDDRYLAVLSHDPTGAILQGSTVSIFETKWGTKVGNLSPRRYNFTAIAFSSEGALLATGANDGRIRLWNLNEILAGGEVDW